LFRSDVPSSFVTSILILCFYTLFPYQIYYSNGHSHLKASLIGPSLTIPFINGQTPLGTWQQIVFVEMDTRSRERKIVVQIIGNN
jgi:secondary thiamine-phosphate synthase enzyme